MLRFQSTCFSSVLRSVSEWLIDQCINVSCHQLLNVTKTGHKAREKQANMSSYWKSLECVWYSLRHRTAKVMNTQTDMVNVSTTLATSWGGAVGTTALTAALASATLAFFRRVLQASRSKRRFSRRRLSFCNTDNDPEGSWAESKDHGAGTDTRVCGRNSHRLPWRCHAHIQMTVAVKFTIQGFHL